MSRQIWASAVGTPGDGMGVSRGVGRTVLHRRGTWQEETTPSVYSRVCEVADTDGYTSHPALWIKICDRLCRWEACMRSSAPRHHALNAESTVELRRLAAQVAALLPANPAEAGVVLDYAREIYLKNFAAERMERFAKRAGLRLIT